MMRSEFETFMASRPWIDIECMNDLFEDLETYRISFEIAELHDKSLRLWIYHPIFEHFYLEFRPWDSDSICNLGKVITALFEKDIAVSNNEQTIRNLTEKRS